MAEIKLCYFCGQGINSLARVCHYCSRSQNWWINALRSSDVIASVISFLVLLITIWQLIEAKDTNVKAKEALDKATTTATQANEASSKAAAAVQKAIGAENRVLEARRDVLEVAQSVIEMAEILHIPVRRSEVVWGKKIKHV